MLIGVFVVVFGSFDIFEYCLVSSCPLFFLFFLIDPSFSRMPFLLLVNKNAVLFRFSTVRIQ